MLPVLKRNREDLFDKNLFDKNLFDDFFGKNGIFDVFFDNLTSSTGIIWNETEDGDIIYEIECPGFNKDNITVDVADGFATIKGERKIKGRHAGVKKIHQRISIGMIDDLKARLEDGILYLTLTFPKREKNKTKIEIK